MGEGYLRPVERYCRSRAFQLRRVQNAGYLPHIRSHHRQLVHKAHGRQQGAGKPQREYNNRQEGLHSETSAAPQQQANRQHRNQYGRSQRLDHAHIFLVVRHPVHIVLRVVLHSLGILPIGPGRLAERLDDLDAADVFHDGVGHTPPHLYSPLPAGGIGLAALRGGDQSDNRGHQRGKPHPPIQNEDIYREEKRHQGVGGHLRDQVCQGGFHPLHTVHNGGLILAGGGVQDGPHRYSGQLGQQGLAQVPQGVISCCMGCGGGHSGKQRLTAIAC